MNYNPYLYQNNYPNPNNAFQPNGFGISPNQNAIFGRMVNGFNEITANDVPMTGGFAYFPKADGSEISVRHWNNNGTISQTVYKPCIEPLSDKVDKLSSNELESHYKAISERLDRIEKMLVPWRRGDDYESTRTITENDNRKQPDNAESDVYKCNDNVSE